MMFYKLEDAEIKMVLDWFASQHHDYSERGYQHEEGHVALAKRLNNFLDDRDRLGWVDEIPDPDEPTNE